jgi:DivIVA domain-containing protein
VDTVDKIRQATFTVARRGYDRREVDNYLSKLADWLEGGGPNPDHRQTVKEELDRVVQRTGKVLIAAQEAADGLRAEGEEEARRVVEDARRNVESTRSSADDYAKRVREEADARAAETLSAAEAKAIRMVEEATRRRREIEKVIADLQTRREAVVRGLEKLSSQLAGAANEGMSVGSGSSQARSDPAPRRSGGRRPAGDGRSSQPEASPPAPTRQ